MARRAVVKDPAHPDFPHGDTRGYSRGCRCHLCRASNTRKKGQQTLARMRGVSATMPVGPVREHVAALTAATGESVGAVARAAGVDGCVLRAAVRCRQQRTIASGIGGAVLAVDADAVTAAAAWAPKAEAVRLIRCLQAQGWPLRDLAVKLGYAEPSRGAPPFLYQTDSMISVGLMRRVQALAEKVGDARGPSKLSADAARRLGFYPLIAYDDDGVLHREWLAGDAGGARGTAHRETLSGDWLRCLSLSLAGKSLTDIAGITGLSERTVQRARERAGIRFAVSDEWGTTVPALGQVAEVRAARAVLADWDGGGVDARTAWKALLRAVAAARAGDVAAVDDEAA